MTPSQTSQPATPATAPDSHQPRVAVLLTGGTIGSGGHDAQDRLDYVDLAKVLTDEEALPLYTFPAGITVYTRRFSRIRSNDASVDFWLRLRRAILDTIADDPHIAGIVFAHGTATLEETAYFLHLTVPTEVPIVLVGAQRPPTAMGSDAQLNLANAVRVAASPASIGHGVLVAMDDEILSARDVTKSDNHRLHTFQARDHGRLGDIDPYGEVWFYRKLLRRHTTGSQFAAELDAYDIPLPRVDLVTMYSGSDELALTAALANGARGVVIASLPPSMNPTAVDAAIDAAIAAGTTIVQSSRASSGRVVQRHGFDARGVIASDTLSPQAARLLLMLCLAAGLSRPEIIAAFATY
jgi:L-asparaginase